MPSFFTSPYGHVKPPLMHAISLKRKKSHVASVAAAAVFKAFTNPRGKNVLIRQSVKYRNMFHIGQGLVRERQPGEQVTPEKGWLTDEEDEAEVGEGAVPVTTDPSNIQEFEVEEELIEEPEVLGVVVEPTSLDHIHDEEDVVKNDLLRLEISLSESTNLEVRNFAGPLEDSVDARTITAETPAPLVISTMDTTGTESEDDSIVEDTNTISEQAEEPSPETRSLDEIIPVVEISIVAEEPVPQPHSLPLVEQPQPEQSTSTTAEESIPLGLPLEPIQPPLPEQSTAHLQPLQPQEKLVSLPLIVVTEPMEREALLEAENTQDVILHQEQEIGSKQVVGTASQLQNIETVLPREQLEKLNERGEPTETVEPIFESVQNEILVSESTANPTLHVEEEILVPESTANPTLDVEEEKETGRIFDVAPPLCIEVTPPQPSEVALVAFSEKHSEQLFDDKESSCTETELNEDEYSEDTDENINQEFEGIFYCPCVIVEIV